MNNNNNDSLIEIALRVMKSKRKEQPLAKICKEVFEIKGIKAEDEQKYRAQFQIDFMLSGLFICVSEKKGVKLWDLKNRRPSSFLDKEGNYAEELDADEDVIKNELSDKIEFIGEENEEEIEEDEEEEETTDEIEEELRSGGYYDGEAKTKKTYDIDEEEDVEDSYDDKDL
ncbi:MAG TPA: DNA-directed RNA polymerase subunit delta [Bacilli bacterium]|nr:DNA-directed RNA polymerase subunit delta [Bacilli bacterium]